MRGSQHLFRHKNFNILNQSFEEQKHNVWQCQKVCDAQGYLWSVYLLDSALNFIVKTHAVLL